MSKEELQNVKGGISKILCIGVCGVVAFVIGIIDGYMRPLKCNK